MDQHTKVDRGWCVLLVWVFRWDAFYYSTRWVSEVSVCVSVCVFAFSLKVSVGIRFAQLPSVYTCRKKEPENNKNKQRVGVITGMLLEERQTLVG